MSQNRGPLYYYLKRNPNGYCGLGGSGVKYPGSVAGKAAAPVRPLHHKALILMRQLIIFEAADCPYCKQFKVEVLDYWTDVPIARTLSPRPPAGWTLEKVLFATPTIVLFEYGKEDSRLTGWNSDQPRFSKWLGYQLLRPAQQKIDFEQGIEYPGTGSHLDEKRPGTSVYPITGAPLFRSDAKFESESGTGWPSIFSPLPDALTEHLDLSHGMRRVEVRSASSGIHLGHVFDDGRHRPASATALGALC